MWWLESDFQQPIVDSRKNWKFDHNAAETMRKIREVQRPFHWYNPPKVFIMEAAENDGYSKGTFLETHIYPIRKAWLKMIFLSFSVGYVSSVEGISSSTVSFSASAMLNGLEVFQLFEVNENVSRTKREHLSWKKTSLEDTSRRQTCFFGIFT